jgi:hypothetical protein
VRGFEDLNHFERELAVKIAFYDLIDGISQGILEIEFSDAASKEKLLCVKAKHNVRLTTLTVLHDKKMRKELEQLALVAAQGSSYDKGGLPIKEGKFYDDSIHDNSKQ